MSLKVKKSGKEPKVGAEVTLGEMSRKTTVRLKITTIKLQTSLGLIVELLSDMILDRNTE